MTHISDETVLNLAHLSRLQLSSDEVSALAADITNILGYVEQLDELDTEGIEPTYQVTGLQNIWHDDTIHMPDGIRETLLALAPKQLENQVKVPKVL